MPHVANWYAGWGMILAAFVTGAGLGLYFHRDEFLGGYASWRRRLTRLGHIALAALGIMNVVYGLSPLAAAHSWHGAAGVGLIVGGISMPVVCFLSAWQKPLKVLFFIPVMVLVVSVVVILIT